MTEQKFQKNDRIRLTITDMGISGEGIGRFAQQEKADPESPVFFVKNAVIGDEVLAVVTRMKKGYGYAKVLEILQPSPRRVRPLCPLAERCGGCQIMQLSYEAQLHFKEEKVRGDLERIGGLSEIRMEPILGMDQDPPAHFRNKMQFPVGWDKEGHVVTGFYAGRTHHIIAAPDCPVSPQVNGVILETIRQFLEKHRVSTYREESGEGLIRHVLIRNGFGSGQIMVCLVINGDDLTGSRLEEGLVQQLTALPLPAPWKIASVCLNINKENTNVILGDEVRCLYGKPYIEELITSAQEGMKPLQFQIAPRSFFQTNPVQTEKLYDTVLEYAGLTGTETVWDLYCGTGTISLFLAQKAGKVYGVEIIPEAIEDARANAQRNGIRNAGFFCGRSEDIFSSAETADVVVLDPPRKGCAPELLEAILQAGPKKIVYVSCDPATLARDVKILCGGGYQMERLRPVDMFPHTVHVETVVLLSKKK